MMSLSSVAGPQQRMQCASGPRSRTYSLVGRSTAACSRPAANKLHTQQPQRSVVARAQSERIKMVNADELQAAIGTARERPIVVDFFATWCGPCLLLATELEKVAAELGDGVDIYKLDVDAKDNQELSTGLQIQGLPTMLFISPNDQKPVLRTEGLLPAETIKNIIKNEL